MYVGARPGRDSIGVAPSARKPPRQRWLRREDNVLDDGVGPISEPASLLELLYFGLFMMLLVVCL